jgi:hypothetical protein
VNYQLSWSRNGWSSRDAGDNKLGLWLAFGRVRSVSSPKTMALYATVGPVCAALSWESPVVRMAICAAFFAVCCLGFALSPHWLDVVGMLAWGINMAVVVKEHEDQEPS